MTYALSITIDLPFDETVEATRDALTTRGVGVGCVNDNPAYFGGNLG